jgi:hypothetical protein
MGLIGLVLAARLTDGDKHVGPFEDLNQLIQNDALIGAGLRLQILFKNTLCIADGLKNYLVAAHANLHNEPT